MIVAPTGGGGCSSAFVGCPGYHAPSRGGGGGGGGCGICGWFSNLGHGFANGILGIYTAPAAQLASGVVQMGTGMTQAYLHLPGQNPAPGIIAGLGLDQFGTDPIPGADTSSVAYKIGYYGGPLLLGGASSAARLRELLGLATEDAGSVAAAQRLPQDIAVSPKAPAPLPLTRPIGSSTTQNAWLQTRIGWLRQAGAFDLRVNQQQVNFAGIRVGINRPDLQYSLNGVRWYEEFETSSLQSAVAHQPRILANDPSGMFLPWYVP